MRTRELKKLFNSELEFLEYKGLLSSIKDETEEYEIKRKELSVIAKKINNNKTRLQEICPHIEKELTKGYERGDYYETGKYIDTTTCKICEKVLNVDVRSTGFYG